jgi:Glycosyl transferases group 1
MASAFVVGSHHLARELARKGHYVAHVSTPISPAHWLAIGRPEVRVRFDLWSRGGVWRSDRLFECVPMGLLPWRASRYLPRGHVKSWLSLNGLRGRLRRNGFDEIDLLLVDQPKMVGVEALVSARQLVYRATDLYGEMERDNYMVTAAREIALQAGLLIGTSEPVVDELKAQIPGKRYLLLENGVDVDLFSELASLPSEYASISHPRLIYAGAFDQRFDFGLIQMVAKALPSANLVLIGPMPGNAATEALRVLPNVHLLGVRPYASMPAYFQHACVGLLPFSAHAANAGRSPMKLYEYGAARLPVVAVWTPELARRALPFVRLARTSHAFVGEIESLLHAPATRRELGDVAATSAKQMGWAGIADKLMAAVMANSYEARQAWQR